jgi:hypothetical protein
VHWGRRLGSEGGLTGGVGSTELGLGIKDILNFLVNVFVRRERI